MQMFSGYLLHRALPTPSGSWDGALEDLGLHSPDTRFMNVLPSSAPLPWCSICTSTGDSSTRSRARPRQRSVEHSTSHPTRVLTTADFASPSSDLTAPKYTWRVPSSEKGGKSLKSLFWLVVLVQMSAGMMGWALVVVGARLLRYILVTPVKYMAGVRRERERGLERF